MNKEMIQRLLDIGAVVVRPNDPFRFSSGIGSPIYCDNRLTLSYPDIRGEIARHFEKMIRDHFPEVELIAGTATAGIPHAAWVSANMHLPMAYVRGSAKSHGKQKQIEGVIKKEQKVVVIEDLISTGGSSLAAAEALRAEGADVLGVVAIFTYQFKKAVHAFQKAKLSLHTITNFTELLDVIELSNEEKRKLDKWHANPASDAWMI